MGLKRESTFVKDMKINAPLHKKKVIHNKLLNFNVIKVNDYEIKK